MGNFKNELSKILRNKNTLTLIIVLAGIVALYVVYNWRINAAITTVQVPYAKKEISSRTQITSDLIGYTNIPKKVANSLGIITSGASVTGNYVKYGYTISENSFFYKDLVVNFEEAVQNEFSDIPDGYTVYNLDVDINSTYGNSIYTGNYIDLYVKAENDNGFIIFGRLFEGIKVLAVLDAQGNDVFESSSEVRVPAQMWFAVPDNFNTLLRGAEYIGGSVKIMPIPRNQSYSNTERDATIDSTYIKSFIESKLLYNNYTSTNTTTTTDNTDNTNNTTTE